jgi:CheY-like chemotaxis protein
VTAAIGIPEADLPHVFDLFSQVKSHRGHSQGGLGIGLSLVRKLVEMHNGSVSVASPGTGGGSTFTVRVPLIQGIDLPDESNLAKRSRRAVPRHRILVVDDNQDAAISFAMLLKEMGHEVDTACDGREGVAKAETFGPDLIFLDLGMPGMDGIEAGKYLRALPGGKSMILVALTGWAQNRDLQRTREAGFDGHLLKPIDPVALDRLLAMPVPAAPHTQPAPVFQ